jgi:hypothetical protein
MVTIFPVGRVQDLRYFVGRCIFSVPDRVIPEFLEQLVSEVLSWPHIEALPASADRPDMMAIRLEQGAPSEQSESFLSVREFARVLLERQRFTWPCH